MYSLEEAKDNREIIDILRNPDQSKVWDIPPVKPKGCETYVVNNKNADDWRCDQYQWKVNGSSSVKSEGGDQLQRKYIKIKTARKNSSKKEKANFTRSSYFLESNRNLVLIRYIGDESSYRSLSHGNSKKEA